MSVPFIYCRGYRNLEIDGRERTERDYKPFIDILRQADFEPHFIHIDWDDEEAGPEDWADDILDQVVDRTPVDGKVVVGGFSFGGLLAYAAVIKGTSGIDPIVSPYDYRYFGASPSPWARPMIDGAWRNPESEVCTIMPEWLQYRLLNFRIWPPLTAPAQIYVGQNEHPRMLEMHSFLTQTALDVTAVSTPRVGHDILNPRYLRKIATHVGKLATKDTQPREVREEYLMRFGRLAYAEATCLVGGEYRLSTLGGHTSYSVGSTGHPPQSCLIQMQPA